MATNYEQQFKVSTPATATAVNPYGRVDEELATVTLREGRRRKRMKCFANVTILAVLITAAVLILALVILKVTTPKFRVRSASFDDNFQVSTLSTNASFSVRMHANLGIRNRNFGRFKYDDSRVEFFYRDMRVGEAPIWSDTTSRRTTEKFTVPVDLSSVNVVPGDVLGNELTQHAWIPLTSRSTLRGKVRVLLFFRKTKYARMDCTMNLNISSKKLQDLVCK